MNKSMSWLISYWINVINQFDCSDFFLNDFIVNNIAGSANIINIIIVIIMSSVTIRAYIFIKK